MALGNLEFAVVVGAARSGTTLLRLMLDSHADVGCPAEAGLPGLMAHMAGVWRTIDADMVSDVSGDTPYLRRQVGADGRVIAVEAREAGTTAGARDAWLADLPDEAANWIRGAMATAMLRYCARAGKRVYVDKSLDSVHHLALVHRLFPQARYVLVFRHVMDTVASGLEASPWGFNGYGYTPYVQRSPTNTVAALASYWLDHVEASLAWNDRQPDLCLRVRYEDLVAHPETTLSTVLRFLEVEADLAVLKRAFDRPPSRGPGDYKVEHTAGVHTASVGHGKRVPVGLVPPPLLAAVNEKLSTLGYGVLDRLWNVTERSFGDHRDDMWTDSLTRLMNNAQVAVDLSMGPFAVLADDRPALRWVVDPESGSMAQGDGEAENVLIGSTQDLVLMLTGEENLGVLIQSGRIRHLVPGESDGAHQEESWHDMMASVALLRTATGAPGDLNGREQLAL